MRRVWVILASATLVVAWGCGNSYDIRLNKTLDDMKYRKRLDEMLMPPLTKNKFEELLIFVRPPKKLELAKEFLLPLPEPGKFDLEASLLETAKAGDSPTPGEAPQPGAEAPKSSEAPKQSLHIVARVKRPKNPASKKKVVEPANRREFTTDLLALVNAAYAPPVEVALDKFKETTKRFNTFKQYAFTVGEKYVQVYFYAPKKDAAKIDPYEVALIFEYPRSEHNNLFGKIDLSLEAFGVGNKAQSALLRRDRRTRRGAGSTRGARRLLTEMSRADQRPGVHSPSPRGEAPSSGGLAEGRRPLGRRGGRPRNSPRIIGSMQGASIPSRT